MILTRNVTRNFIQKLSSRLAIFPTGFNDSYLTIFAMISCRLRLHMSLLASKFIMRNTRLQRHSGEIWKYFLQFPNHDRYFSRSIFKRESWRKGGWDASSVKKKVLSRRIIQKEVSKVLM
ncbi:uncharacterized protein LOC122530214 [Frieseomelitta varia]|uniref:uncharacterized protein LOC122530214 n=1 Tax=Frieseomelitta varia TaxID=561572 RepID=UPI001CB6825C|nr:uncharacterized protein LOC122530214 [Frieseomelitta varia]